MRDTGHGRLLPYVGSARPVGVTHVICGPSRPFHADQGRLNQVLIPDARALVLAREGVTQQPDQ